MKDGSAARVLGLVIIWLPGVFAGCAAPDDSAESPRAPATAVSRWAPQIGMSWQYQLEDPVDTRVKADVFDVDAFNVDASVVKALHTDGKRAICYVNVGAYENWRPDVARFPEDVIGDPLDGWPGESWLDVRRLDVLEPIMATRLDMCRDKGFDAVEPDNLDGYADASGFPITTDDQLRYNRMIARLAHDRSLGVGLKNDLNQVEELVGDFDFAVNESCVEERECPLLTPFIQSGKAVLHVEYNLRLGEFCPVTKPLRFSSIGKPLELTAPVEFCAA
ncbi:MAG TPA: endo alpha-1,4 polygalactosaminidase [Mycobacterium sp.]|nr:endo alpha-1,4 polygalactosaminidase [Mycobacterium sp.]